MLGYVRIRTGFQHKGGTTVALGKAKLLIALLVLAAFCGTASAEQEEATLIKDYARKIAEYNTLIKRCFALNEVNALPAIINLNEGWTTEKALRNAYKEGVSAGNKGGCDINSNAEGRAMSLGSEAKETLWQLYSVVEEHGGCIVNRHRDRWLPSGHPNDVLRY
jgi:hypothetical protein